MLRLRACTIRVKLSTPLFRLRHASCDARCDRSSSTNMPACKRKDASSSPCIPTSTDFCGDASNEFKHKPHLPRRRTEVFIDVKGTEVTIRVKLRRSSNLGTIDWPLRKASRSHTKLRKPYRSTSQFRRQVGSAISGEVSNGSTLAPPIPASRPHIELKLYPEP